MNRKGIQQPQFDLDPLPEGKDRAAASPPINYFARREADIVNDQRMPTFQQTSPDRKTPLLALLSHGRAAALLLMFAVLVAMPGCMLPFRSPAGFEHIELESVDSENVQVQLLWLDKNEDGLLQLVGKVGRERKVEDTTSSYIEVKLFDQNETLLHRKIVYFEPRSIPRRPRSPHGGSVFHLEFEELDPSVAKIQATARDS